MWALGLALFAGVGILLIRAERISSQDVAQASWPPTTEVVLWAWERPEALGFLPPETEVAVLVGTLRLTASGVSRYPRLQPVELPKATRRLAVVRLASDPEQRSRLTETQRRQAVETILAWSSSPPGFAELQIDFDATVSERPFYRRLLEDLSSQLPSGTPLSITALASWCLGDPWMADLPIREAVPMLFRMGLDAEAVRQTLARGEDFRDPRCRSSYGLATDEALPPLRPGRRLYLFHPRAWTESAYGDFRRQLNGQPLTAWVPTEWVPAKEES